MNRVLVVGQGRSGTTWVGEVLGRSDGAAYVHEPDDERRDPLALRAALSLGWYPVLAPDAPADVDDAYQRLWRGVFEGGRPASSVRARAARRLLRSTPRPAIRAAVAAQGHKMPTRLRLATLLAAPRGGPAPQAIVAKSVRAIFAVEWLAQHLGATVVVVTRHPLDVLASRLELGWSEHEGVPPEHLRRMDVQPLPEGASELSGIGWQIGVFGTALADSAARHREWIRVRHEDLCRAPADAFAELCRKLDLTWSDEQRRFLTESDRDGTGWAVQRVAAELPEAWRHRLSPDQADEAFAMLERFPRALDGYR